MLTPKFTNQQIRQYLSRQKDLIEQAILNRFIRLGEIFVTNARNNGTYKDHTGNLRSSIGYIIFKDGRVVYESFPGSKSPGVEAAKRIANKIYETLGDFKGFVFAGIAGMNYAAAVESKGRDVITSSSIEAKNDLIKSMKELQDKLNKAR